MEKLRELDMHFQKVHQERLRLERKMKMQEAQEIQNNVLHSKTLENELRIIDKQKEAAFTRNEKILSDSLNKLNSLNEKISQNSLKRSSDRLKNAKIQYFEVVTAGFPDWMEAIKNPELFQTRKMQENLEKLKNLQQTRELEHKKHLESQMEMVKSELYSEFKKTSEQLRSGIAEEQDLMKLRERSRKEFEAKIEEERQNLRSQLEKMRAEEMARQEEMLREVQKEVISEGLRISTPNAHIPNVFHLRRPDESLPGMYDPKKYDVQKFSIDRPSSVGVRAEVNSSHKSPNLSISKAPMPSYQIEKSEIVIKNSPDTDSRDLAPKIKKSEYSDPKPTKIEHTQPAPKQIEPVVEIKKINSKKNEFVQPIDERNRVTLSNPEGSEPRDEYKNPVVKKSEPKPVHSHHPEPQLKKPEHVEPKIEYKEKVVVKSELSKTEPKIAKVEYSEIDSVKVEAKGSKSDSGKLKSETKPSPKANVSSLPIDEKITKHQAIKKIIEDNDEDNPSSLRVPSHNLHPSLNAKIIEQNEPSISDSNEFDYDKIDLPDNTSNSKPSTSTIKNNTIQINDDDFDSGIQIIRGPQTKFQGRKSEEGQMKGKKEVFSKPDIKIETKSHKNVKPVEIDDEFEIKTVKSKPLKVPEIDESLEDSSQLVNDYLQGVINRESGSKASSKIESRPATSKASVKNEEIGLKKDLSSKNLTEPLSPSGISSTTGFFEVKMIAQNLKLNSISVQQRKITMQALLDLLRDNLTKSGSKLVNFNEELTMQRVEKMYENYLINKQSFKYKSNEELLGFILVLGKTLPDCFLPSDLAKSKHPFTEMMIREKMRPEHFLIYGLIKEFLVESIVNGWVKEKMAVDMFVDTLVNFTTSKSQYTRCKGCLEKALRAELSRPPTSNKDASIEIMRVVTPNDRNLGSRLVAKTGAYGGRVSEIEAFNEIIDDY